MEISDRFGQLWAEWDARLAAGEPPGTILSEASDEQLLRLLGGESVLDRKYARDIIVTEVLNRLHRRARDLPAGASVVLESAVVALKAAADGQQAIHTAEGLLHSSGDHAIAGEVSGSAYSSLDAARAAFENAKTHAQGVAKMMVASESSAEFAQDVAAAADRGTLAMEGLEERLELSGHGEEGRAAVEAAAAISRAADLAAADAEDQLHDHQDAHRQDTAAKAARKDK